MSSVPAPRIDRRRIRTRAALIAAGQTLFAQRSVDGVSIDEIVDAASVAKGSFYNHFPDKAALAEAIAEAIRDAVEAAVAEINAGVADPAERLARALCAFARRAATHPAEVGAMSRLFRGASIPDAPMNAGVRADIQAGLTAGRFSGLSLETAVLMAVGVVQIAVAQVVEQQSPTPPAGLARDLAFGLLRGLGVEAEAARRTAARAALDIFR